MSLARVPRDVPDPGRGRRPGLIERAVELDAIAAAVTGLGERVEGGVLVVEAQAGLGKTALADHAAQLARTPAAPFAGPRPARSSGTSPTA